MAALGSLNLNVTVGGNTAKPVAIDVVNVLDALDTALVAKGRDYRCPNPGECIYIEHGGQPSCLIGFVLHLLGVPAKELSWVGDVCNGPIQSGSLLTRLEESGVIRIAQDQRSTVIEALRAAQHQQDKGETWGYAVSVAQEVIARIFTVETKRVAVQRPSSSRPF